MTWRQEFLSGWFSGMFGIIVGHPFDTIKVRMQAYNEKSIKKALIKIWKYEGFRGYFSGMLFPLLTAGAYNGTFFGFSGNAEYYLAQKKGIKDPKKEVVRKSVYKGWYWDLFFSGCIGGFSTVIVSCPVELVKTQLQVQGITGTKFEGPFSCLRTAYKLGGVQKCFTGIMPMFCRDIPSFGIYMVVYEEILHEFLIRRGENILFHSTIAGGFSGVVSWLPFFPFDVVKTRIQSDCLYLPKYRNMFHCFMKTYKTEGLFVFYRGFWVCSVRAFPVNAVTFFVYETFMKWFHILSIF